MKLGFHGAAFVWHRRRASFFHYFKQQKGYGKAEAMLMDDHPDRFDTNGNSIWKGVVYQGGSISAQREHTIYSGPMGEAAYQHIESKVMPIRPLHRNFKTHVAEKKLQFAYLIHPSLRAISRIHYSNMANKWKSYLQLFRKYKSDSKPQEANISYIESAQTSEISTIKSSFIQEQINAGWSILYNDPDWDLEHSSGSKMLLCQENLGGGLWCLRVRHYKKEPE